MVRNVQRSFLLFFVLAFAMSFTCRIQADAPSDTIPQKTVRVGYIPNYGMGTQNTGGMHGYTYDFLNEIAKETGWDYEFVECTQADYFIKLQNGELDLIGPVQYSKEREKDFTFSKTQMDYGFQYLVTQKDKELYYEDFQAFDGMKVGVTYGSFYSEMLNQYCEKYQFSVVQTAADGQRIGEELKEGKYDAAVITSLFYIPGMKIIAQLNTVPFYFVTSKDRPDIMEQLDDAMSKVSYKRPYLISELRQKYYGDTIVAFPSYTREEAEFIKNARVYRVVADPDWPPYEKLNPKTSTYEGINVDIIREISAISGLKFEFIPTVSYQESLDLISSGQADLLIGDFDMLEDFKITCSDIYLEVPMILAGQQMVDVDQTLTVAMPGLLNPVSAAAMKKHPHLTYKNYGSGANVISALRNGKENLAFIDLYTFNEVVRKESTRSYYTIPLDIYVSMHIGIGSHVDPALKNILNTTIQRLGKETVSSIVFSNTARNEYRVPVYILLRENIILVLIVVMLFSGSLLLIVVITSRKKRKAIEEIAYVDRLTGLSTYVKFMIDAKELLKSAKPGEYMVVSMDINHFKYINDTFGYSVGDSLLKSLGECFLEEQKERRLFCHVTADKFVLLLSALPLEYMKGQFDKLDFVNRSIHKDLLRDIPISFCVGMYIIEDPKKNLFVLVDNANLARKSAKGGHANEVVMYDSDLEAEVELNKEITMTMEHALQNNEFEVFLQPKFSLDTHTIAGAEALVRWNHPALGLLMPDTFIPLFEKNGFIQKFDLYMFERVCMLIQKWIRSGLADRAGKISVNLSRRCIRYPNLCGQLLSLTHQYEVQPRLMEIELTESIAENDLDYLTDVLKTLHDAGFFVSIDDFGSGYSSLNLLTKLQVDTIKIDRIFLSETYGMPGGKEVILQMINLIHALHMESVAEGIETEDQASCLRGFSCDLAQGYYFSRPIPVDQFEKDYLHNIFINQEGI